MCLYQFLIAVRADGAQLTSVDGETTSHLMGTFYRTIRLLENGLVSLTMYPDNNDNNVVLIALHNIVETRLCFRRKTARSQIRRVDQTY